METQTVKEGSGSGMLKREDTLALTCSLMYLYGSSMLPILITDSFLTSTPDPIGKKQNTGKEEQHSTWHRCNAHTSMMNVNIKELELNPITWRAI